MRILLVGAGGVGSALARIAARRPFAELVVADYDLARAQRAAAARDGYEAVQLDARDEGAVAELLTRHRCDVLMNATDPRFVMPLFRAALSAGVHYLDMAMSLSHPDPQDPYRKTGVKLGDDQFAMARQWEESGKLALVGIGVEPGLSDVFARYAADELFGEISELGVRDGANLTVSGYDFAPTFSIWTTIEECLNPPVIWERGRGWFTTEPFSEPEVFTFPAGIGPVECVNVEHEEVLLMPRWIQAQRVTFKYGLGAEFIGILRTLHQLGLDRTDPVQVGAVSVSPRDVLAACLPDPATLGDKMSGLTCAGTWVTGTGRDGARGVPVPRGRQQLVDGRVRLAGGGLADRGQPGGRAGADRERRLVRIRRAGSRGAAATAVPRPAHRVRLAMGTRGAEPSARLAGPAGATDLAGPAGAAGPDFF
jgi:saccharopine dehydrogenase-like NADP-dependent oxidoreductase